MTLLQRALLPFTLALCVVLYPVSASSATASWANCKMHVDFDGDATRVMKTVNRADFSTLEIQTAVRPGSAQMAFCVPGDIRNAQQLQDAIAPLLEDARFRNVQTRLTEAPSGPTLLRTAKFQANDGTLMRAESKCLGLPSRIACATFIGSDADYPTSQASKFFASFRDAQSPAAIASAGKALSPLELYAGSLIKRPIPGVDKQPWAVCIEPLGLQRHADAFVGTGRPNSDDDEQLRLLQDEALVRGVSQLAEYRTQYGKRYVLLAKRSNAKNNSTYECEVSHDGTYILGRPINR